jgi:hypothetical protein
VPLRDRPIVFARRVQDRFQLKSVWQVPVAASLAIVRRGVRAVFGSPAQSA